MLCNCFLMLRRPNFSTRKIDAARDRPLKFPRHKSELLTYNTYATIQRSNTMAEKRLSLLLPISTRKKINDLVPSRGKAKLLQQLIREYDGETLEEDTATNSVFPLDEADIKALDAIQAQNGIRSRNLTMILLINLAHAREKERERERLNPSTPRKSGNKGQ